MDHHQQVNERDYMAHGGGIDSRANQLTSGVTHRGDSLHPPHVDGDPYADDDHDVRMTDAFLQPPIIDDITDEERAAAGFSPEPLTNFSSSPTSTPPPTTNQPGARIIHSIGSESDHDVDQLDPPPPTSIDLLDDDEFDHSRSRTSEPDTNTTAHAGEDVTDVEDDDELTILAVRRALHLPTHPTRIIHSPVNLLDDDDEEEETNKKKKSTHGEDEEVDPEADVCAICLSIPTEYTTPSSCQHAFCFTCVEQWTKIQLTAIYQAQEEAQWATNLPNFVPASQGKQKKAPSCPLCKREYQALHRRNLTGASPKPIASTASPSPSPPPAAASSSSPSTSNGRHSPQPQGYDVIPIASVLPPPKRYYRPTLTLDANYNNNEYFRLAADAAFQFAMRTAPGLRVAILHELLANHPRVNQLLLSYPPFRENLREVRSDLIRQVLQSRARELRRQSIQNTQQSRQQLLRMDHGGGVEQVPMMTDANAHTQLANRLSPYGTSSLLSLAFGQPEPVYTNPIITLYRESRISGGMTTPIGRIKLWSDLQLSHVPPQPDVIWALRRLEVGAGMIPFPETINTNTVNTAAAAASATHFNTPSTAASASSAPTPPPDGTNTAAAYLTLRPRVALSRWLHIELTSLLSSRSELVNMNPLNPPVQEHFMVVLVLSYLELLLTKLELEENQVKLMKQKRLAERGVKRSRARKEQDESKETTSSSTVAASATQQPSLSVPQTSTPTPVLPSLASSFVPSYFSQTSSLHPVAADASMTRTMSDEDGPSEESSGGPAPTATAATSATAPSTVEIIDDEDVVVVSERMADRDVVVIDDDDSMTPPTTAAPTPAAAQPASRSDSTSRRPRPVTPSHLPGGHLHTLFALSAPLSSSIDFLYGKLQEFLRGFTGVFVHRLLLFILSQSYHSPGSGPSPTDARFAVANPIVHERTESSISELLEDSRRKWRQERNRVVYGNAEHPASQSDNAPSNSQPTHDNEGVDQSAPPIRPAHPPARASDPRLSEEHDEVEHKSNRTTAAAAATTSSSSTPILDRPPVIRNPSAYSRPSRTQVRLPLRPPPEQSTSDEDEEEHQKEEADEGDLRHHKKSRYHPPRRPSTEEQLVRRYTEEDQQLLSGMKSAKRPANSRAR